MDQKQITFKEKNKKQTYSKGFQINDILKGIVNFIANFICLCAYARVLIISKNTKK